jgi:hypothetical protein
MKLTHRFAQLRPEKRPQDPRMDGTGLRFETMEHGGVSRRHAPSHQVGGCRRPLLHLRPITQDGKVVDSQGYILDLED